MNEQRQPRRHRMFMHEAAIEANERKHYGWHEDALIGWRASIDEDDPTGEVQTMRFQACGRTREEALRHLADLLEHRARVSAQEKETTHKRSDTYEIFDTDQSLAITFDDRAAEIDGKETT